MGDSVNSGRRRAPFIFAVTFTAAIIFGTLLGEILPSVGIVGSLRSIPANDLSYVLFAVASLTFVAGALLVLRHVLPLRGDSKKASVTPSELLTNANEQVDDVSRKDSLTGLANRHSFVEQVEQAIEAAKQNGRGLALFLVDLDRFRNINDSLGHTIGDRLLEIIASRLTKSVREADILARLGGDEFAILAPGMDGNEDATRVAERVLGAVAEPAQVDEHEIRVSASVGISTHPDNGKTAEEFLQSADAAMYAAKKRGRGRYSFSSRVLTDAVRTQNKIEMDLMNACSRDEFVIYYQPIVDANSDRVIGMEALLRWKHPKRGIVPPDQFFPLLEELGLMIETSVWVLRTACRQATEWTRQGLPPFRMTVNISPQQFYQGSILNVVQSVLKETGLPPQRLELEFTESRSLDNSEAIVSIMQGLRNLGVSLSLDDFGTGWSTLPYIGRYPINRIKIDRIFINDLTKEPAAKAMVRSLLYMAESLQISTTAEGVETVEQKRLLKEMKCPEMQGFYFGRPVPAMDAGLLLQKVRL